MKFTTMIITKLLLSVSIVVSNKNVLAFSSSNNYRNNNKGRSSSSLLVFDINTSTRRSSSSSSSPSLLSLSSLQPQRSLSSTSSSRLLATKKEANNNNDDEVGFFSDVTINPVYAVPWFVFLIVATYFSITETSGASQALINNFIANPLHPGFGSSLFETEWNLIGLIGLPLATLIMPSAKKQKLNPTPFLFASALAGYGALGPFMMTRKPVYNVESKDELGWFTTNVLETKIFNWILFILFMNAYVISGAGSSLITDFSGTFEEFKNMIGQSALGTATTVDFTILCLTGASLIPEDLKRRGINDPVKLYAIAISTLLLPAAGLALYSALRPTLPVLMDVGARYANRDTKFE